MSTLSRKPKHSLRSFVRVLWASSNEIRGESALCSVDSADAKRELVLPAGTAHLVFRLDVPLRIFQGRAQGDVKLVGHQVLGGPRSAPYLRCVELPVSSVGAELLPGALSLMVGDRADVFAQSHMSLSEIWGAQTSFIEDELREITDPEGRLVRFESFLEEHFQRGRELHPAVRHALLKFPTTTDVRAVADSTGYSERRFSSLFREAVGLSPKVYARLQRFQGALDALHAGTESIGRIAMRAGYADQAHFSRDFREFAALTPQEYRNIAPVQARHVPLRS